MIHRLACAFIFVLVSLSSSAFADRIPESEVFVRWKSGTPIEVRNGFYAKQNLRPVWRSALVPGLEGLAIARPSQRVLDVRALQSDPAARYAFYVQSNERVHRELGREIGMNRSAAFRSPFERILAAVDPMFKDQWALQAKPGIDIESAWKVSTGSNQVRVAVIDTGVDTQHPDLKGRVVAGYDFIDNSPKVYDDHGHGSHCSGIIGALTGNGEGISGINQNISLVSARAVPSNGDETDENVMKSIEFAVQNGARVANGSFGKAKSSQAVADVIAAAGEKGLLFVVAAGNDSKDINANPTYPASFQTPNMIVVAASTSRGTKAGFSNYGKGKVDLAAPGARILSSVKGGSYATWDGTSMAAPHVAGVAALVLSVNPQFSVAQVKKILLSSVEVDGGLASAVTTSGRLNAAKAVELAQKTAATPSRGDRPQQRGNSGGGRRF